MLTIVDHFNGLIDPIDTPFKSIWIADRVTEGCTPFELQAIHPSVVHAGTRP